jgi:membrane fusion protein, multidrug efflux system
MRLGNGVQVRRVLIVGLCAAVVLTTGCSSGSSDSGATAGAGGRTPEAGGAAAGGGRNGRAGGPAEVGFIVMQPQRAALTAELPGRTVPWRVAQVRPQISGIIQRRLFIEGANVQAGQPLYQIDPGTYQSAHESAQAAVAKAEANALTAKLRYDRYVKLAASGVVSQQERDDVTASLRQAEADLATAKAALHTAAINLSYTRIVAPIAGRIGTSDFTEGALVTANQQAALTTIQQLNPMYVDLTQSSDELLRLRSDLAAGNVQRLSGSKAEVRLLLGDGSTYAHTGELTVTDVTVSETTGAVTLRAVVPNPEGQLLPGMFVRAQLQQGVSDGALVLPQRAVLRSDSGESAVMLVGADNKVQRRVVELGAAVGTGWVVSSGLAAGDRVIVEGVQRIHDGDSVRAVAAGSAPQATMGHAAAGARPASGN